MNEAGTIKCAEPVSPSFVTSQVHLLDSDQASPKSTKRKQSRLRPQLLVAMENVGDRTRERKLPDGRTIVYHLKIIQEPQRARACGSGAKCKWLEFNQTLPQEHGEVFIDSVGENYVDISVNISICGSASA